MLITSGKQTGGGLIEVLASMIIVTVGVLGTLSMQNRSVQFNRGAMLESNAAILAADMIDRIRANPSQAMGYRIGLNDSIPSYKDCQNKDVTCTVQQLASFDVGTWREEIAASLPEGKGEVENIPSAGGVSIFVITVQYQDDRAEKASAFYQNYSSGSPPKQVILRTSI